MFMRVIAKCAHQVRPPLRPNERRELRHLERDQGAAGDGTESARTQTAALSNATSDWLLPTTFDMS
jgi:hypothetical protein